jgi:hypothetical protein
VPTLAPNSKRFANREADDRRGRIESRELLELGQDLAILIRQATVVVGRVGIVGAQCIPRRRAIDLGAAGVDDEANARRLSPPGSLR